MKKHNALFISLTCDSAEHDAAVWFSYRLLCYGVTQTCGRKCKKSIPQSDADNMRDERRIDGRCLRDAVSSETKPRCARRAARTGCETRHTHTHTHASVHLQHTLVVVRIIVVRCDESVKCVVCACFTVCAVASLASLTTHFQSIFRTRRRQQPCLNGTPTRRSFFYACPKTR